jgi:hypothetical protein
LPHQRITDPEHHRGLFAPSREPVRPAIADPALLGYQEGMPRFERPLASYAELLGATP